MKLERNVLSLKTACVVIHQTKITIHEEKEFTVRSLGGMVGQEKLFTS